MGGQPARSRRGCRFSRGEGKNETHASTTDPDARLFKKSKGSEAKLSYLGHVLMENRNGLLVETFLTEANGRAEREAAMLMAEAIPAGKRVTLGGDKNYDTQEFVRELRGMNITLTRWRFRFAPVPTRNSLQTRIGLGILGGIRNTSTSEPLAVDIYTQSEREQEHGGVG
jgi:hypothetical protein